jgi:biopolymer transport protein ExbD
MQFARKPRRRPFINIIPLIDVLVVLLIFYIATTVFKRSQPKVVFTVPKSNQATATQETLPTIIYITSEGKYFIDDQPVEGDQLADALKARLAGNPALKIALKSDEKAPFGAFVKVMDAARSNGIENIPTFANPEGAAPGAGAPTP